MEQRIDVLLDLFTLCARDLATQVGVPIKRQPRAHGVAIEMLRLAQHQIHFQGFVQKLEIVAPSPQLRLHLHHDARQQQRLQQSGVAVLRFEAQLVALVEPQPHQQRRIVGQGVVPARNVARRIERR